MGAWAIVGVTIFLLGNCIDSAITSDYDEFHEDGDSGNSPIENSVRKFVVNSGHSAKRFDYPVSEPISVPFTTKDAIVKNYNSYQDPYHEIVGEFSKDDDYQRKEFLGDTSDYKQYENSRRQSYEGPYQKEMIQTQSFHRKSEPFSLHEFDSKHKEEHAEVHYHQHKHLHKHAHKQEHKHHHKQDHKHHHAHKHKEEGLHKHNHKHDHKHKHHNDHHHKHEAHHKHEHKQDHKHDHHHGHKHEHKHHHGHKHDAHHKHSHKQEHKHKHDHHHGHKHGHKHSHHNDHKHKHGHKHHHEHKHGHKHHKH